MKIRDYKELKPFIEGEFRNGGFWIKYKTKSQILKDIENVCHIFDSIKYDWDFKGAENMGNRISYIKKVLEQELSEDPIKNSALFAFSIVEGIRISYREPFSEQLEGILNVLLEKLNQTDHSYHISMMGFRIAGYTFCTEFEERKEDLNREQKEKWINAGRFLSSFYSEIGLHFVAAAVSYTIEKEQFKQNLIEQYIEVVKEFQFIKEIILDQFQIPYLGFSGRVKTLSSIILSLRNNRETRVIFPDDLVGFRFILEDLSNYPLQLIPRDSYIANSSTIIFHSGKKHGEEQISIGDLLILPSSTPIIIKENQRNYNAIHCKLPFELNERIYVPTEVQMIPLDSYLSATPHSQYKASNIPELEPLPKATEVARKFFGELLGYKITIDIPTFFALVDRGHKLNKE
jgi:hypothetical protein